MALALNRIGAALERQSAQQSAALVLVAQAVDRLAKATAEKGKSR